MRRWLILLVCALGVLGASAAERFNLLLITADDLNGDSMGWMGSKLGATPNIDAFAQSCHRFAHHHVTVPICQPSRSAFMTGRVPHRNGALGFHPINPDVPTLPDTLKNAGYFTAGINKLAHMKPDTRFPWEMRHDGSGKNPKLLGQQVAECLKAAADAKKPFFINANITDPHRPFPQSEQESARKGKGNKNKKAGKSEANDSVVKSFPASELVIPGMLEELPDIRKEIGQYFSGVNRFDQSFGEIIGALKTSGQMDNTVIVFLSDHGISAPFSKATLYRNGTWTPLLLRFPGMGKPSVNKTDFISSVDIMPSVLEILGVKAPEGMDGRSFVPLLKGQKQPNRDYVITHVNSVSSGKSFPSRCIRTHNFSYIWNAWPDGQTQYRVEAMNGLTFNALARAGESDPVLKERVQHWLFRTPEEFYDISKDPNERRNLINDAAAKKEIDRLKKILLAHMEKTNDPQLAKFKATLP
ncbi:MAG: sulfatase [Verrucomicrobiota bacterium]